MFERFFFWKNAFMDAWFFFNAYMMYVWSNFFYEKMHLWNFGLFLFKNAWFFFRFFLFSFNMYACIIFFWECIYKWNFWECIYDVRNSRKMHKRFCECIHRYSQADFVPLKIHAWKSIFYFLLNFSIFFLNGNAWMDARNCNF